MEWSKDKPTVPGWYWWRFCKTTIPYPIEITMTYGVIEVCADNWPWEYTDLAHGEWAGPIPEPTDPKEA